MTDKKNELNDKELENVSGGALIGSLEKDDIDSLKAGTMLIWENWLGKDLARVMYTGQYKGVSKMEVKYVITNETYLYVTIDKLYVTELKDDSGHSCYPGSSHWVKIRELDFLENA